VTDKIILQVENNRKDEEITRRAFKKNDICGEVVVTRDGVEALDHLFAGGADLGLPNVPSALTPSARGR
jgi:two-component system, response regulator